VIAIGTATSFGYLSARTTVTTIAQTVVTIETQTIITIEQIDTTVTPYCCIDPNITIATSCNVLSEPDFTPIQRMQYLVETNPKFIVAENGLYYVSDGTIGCGKTFDSSGLPNITILNFYFTHTTDNLFTNNCGGVENFTYYLYVTIPLTETGYNMTSMEITPTNSSQVTYSCSMSITSSGETGNTTN